MSGVPTHETDTAQASVVASFVYIRLILDARMNARDNRCLVLKSSRLELMKSSSPLWRVIHTVFFVQFDGA